MSSWTNIPDMIDTTLLPNGRPSSRKGLRLHDNPALLDSCKGASCVYPVFVLDPNYADPGKVGVLR